MNRLPIVFLGLIFVWSSKAEAGPTGKPTSATQTSQLRVVYSRKVIPEGRPISGDQIAERFLPASRCPKDSLAFAQQAIGKVTVRSLEAGEVVRRADVKAPTKPQRGENWLISFPNTKLEKLLGKKITVKGYWLTRDREHYSIMDYQSSGRIYVNRLDFDQLLPKHSFDEMQCVVATGLLKKCQVNPQTSKQTKFCFEPHQFKVIAGQW